MLLVFRLTGSAHGGPLDGLDIACRHRAALGGGVIVAGRYPLLAYAETPNGVGDVDVIDETQTGRVDDRARFTGCILG